VDVKGMVEDVFQCNDEPPTLKEKAIGIVGEVFGVADGVEEEVNGSMIMLLILEMEMK